MKRIAFPFLGLLSLCVISFTKKNDSIEVIESTSGKYLTNTHLLHIDDLKALQEMTVTSVKGNTVIITSIYKHAFKTTIYTDDKKADVALNSKMTAIIEKYQ